MIERDFDVAFVAGLALREKQIQQNYRPVIAVHKWFARRPGTLFRALLLAEFAAGHLSESFYEPHIFTGKVVVDPFMGGGTPLLEANRTGCDIVGYDINPMAYWIVREEIEHIDLRAYRGAAEQLREALDNKIGHLYRTVCLHCGSTDARVKYFLWVKTQPCRDCHSRVDLFPGYLLAEDRRHPKNVIICVNCGELNECEDLKRPGNCRVCAATLLLIGPAKKNRCRCLCGAAVEYPDSTLGPPWHRMFAIEYYCPKCKGAQRGRFFKKPDDSDLAKMVEAEDLLTRVPGEFIPDDQIPCGDETNRLHRWGYKRYAEMFNARQLVGLALSCELISREGSERIGRALATNLSDLLRYQNMLCRYDSMALKSLDIFSVHGFPVGLIQCESNLLGIPNGDSGGNIGSGGWSNIVEKYARGKAYCEQPFEIRNEAGQKKKIRIVGEWIGDAKNGSGHPERRSVDLRCDDAALAELSPASVDAVFTDPPYFGNVQYAELMDFCYVWLRRLAGLDIACFQKASTRNEAELTGNESMQRGLEHFTEGLSAVFRRMALALKPGAPLVFTYHHNKMETYYPVAAAILDAGLTCSASLPCPGEMGASIHISGTESSIIDTVFVCRTEGVTQRHLIAQHPESIADLVAEDVRKLRAGGVVPTRGDIRCIIRGHLTRLAVWGLRRAWSKTLATPEKLGRVRQFISRLGGVDSIEGQAAVTSGLAQVIPVPQGATQKAGVQRIL